MYASVDPWVGQEPWEDVEVGGVSRPCLSHDGWRALTWLRVHAEMHFLAQESSELQVIVDHEVAPSSS